MTYRVSNGRESDRHMDKTPIPIDTPGFVVLGSFAVTNSLENFQFVSAISRGNHQGYIPAENFVGTVPEHPLRCRIPGGHNPLQVARDNRFLGKFANGSKFQFGRTQAVIAWHKSSLQRMQTDYTRNPCPGYTSPFR